MNQTSRGVGRVVVLVLFSVLFVAAWSNDHPGRGLSTNREARTVVPRPATATIIASAAAIGETLPSCAAARLAPAHRTNGQTLPANRGVCAALGRAFPAPATGAAKPAAQSRIGVMLGAQLAEVKRTHVAADFGFIGNAAFLRGTWHAAGDVTAAELNRARDEGSNR